MNQRQFVAVKMNGYGFCVGNQRQCAGWQLVLSEQTRADIIMGNDHAGAAELRITAGMIAVVVGVQHDMGDRHRVP